LHRNPRKVDQGVSNPFPLFPGFGKRLHRWNKPAVEDRKPNAPQQDAPIHHQDGCGRFSVVPNKPFSVTQGGYRGKKAFGYS